MSDKIELLEINELLLEEAKKNFENLELAFPIVKNHPFYMIAKAQLDSGLGYATLSEALKPRA